MISGVNKLLICFFCVCVRQDLSLRPGTCQFGQAAWLENPRYPVSLYLLRAGITGVHYHTQLCVCVYGMLLVSVVCVLVNGNASVCVRVHVCGDRRPTPSVSPHL